MKKCSKPPKTYKKKKIGFTVRTRIYYKCLHERASLREGGGPLQWWKEPAKIEVRWKTGEHSSPLHGGRKPPPYNVPGILCGIFRVVEGADPYEYTRDFVRTKFGYERLSGKGRILFYDSHWEVFWSAEPFFQKRFCKSLCGYLHRIRRKN